MADLEKLASQQGIQLTTQQLARFATYEAMLLAWNAHTNLTAIRDPAGVRIRHFLDALTCTQATGDLNNQHLIDIGTGAGFPGLPLKLCYPSLQLTLVDSVKKKTAFLHAVVERLQLTNVTILSERAETLGQHPLYREKFDWVVGRAVADLRVLAEYLLPLCKLGGHILAQKGVRALEEANRARDVLTLLGGSEPKLYEVNLPGRDTPHYLITSQKIAPTPSHYPRRPGIPAKRPL